MAKTRAIKLAVEVEAEGIVMAVTIGFLGRFSRKSLETLGFPR